MAYLENSMSPLNSLLDHAAAIESQIGSSSDNEEVSDLANDLIETNNRIASAPCATLDQVRAKASHLLRVIEEEIDPIDADVLRGLLKSLAGR